MEFEDPWANPNTTPKLRLLTKVPMFQSSPEHSGMQTPPHPTLASIPFQWEEQPGKPRPCTRVIPFFTNSEPRCLELPPRLLFQETQKITTKNSSPVTVLEGPYLSRSSRFISSSFRLFRERQGSFDSIGSISPDVESGDFVNGIFGREKLQKRSGFLGSWKRKLKSKVMKKGGKEDIGSASFVYRSSMERRSLWNDGGHKINRVSNVTKNGSSGSFSQAKSHFWVSFTALLNLLPAFVGVFLISENMVYKT